MLLSGLLFAASSILTGWSYQFWLFILWRIAGGAAIGLAANISPTYIAEVSPASCRGRLVSLNQLAIVLGILAAQITNWKIAQGVPASATQAMIAMSWNGQFAWRWMFTAVSIPALFFFALVPFIPESPRWLIAQGRMEKAKTILSRIGGPEFGTSEADAIDKSLSGSFSDARWQELFQPRARRLLALGIALAVLQQGSGINILFNYAEEVYRSAGYGVSEILFNIVVTGAINLLFTLLAMLLVDTWGRRQLMLVGCLGIGCCHLAASYAYYRQLHGLWILVLTLSAIACYAMTLAPITWVLITEIFPNQIRAAGVSISVAALWLSSFALTYSFPALNRSIGTSGTFLTYSGICFAGAFLVYLAVPETKGTSLDLPASYRSGSEAR